MEQMEKEHGDEFYEGIAHTLHMLELGAEVVEKLGLPDSATSYRNTYAALCAGLEESGEFNRVADQYRAISGHDPL